MPSIETVRGPITLSTDARDELLDKVGSFENGKPVIRTFEKAGLGDPVELDLDRKRLVVEAISSTSPTEG